MAHTHSRYMQDLGFNDARILASAGGVTGLTTGGSFTLTRVGVADYSLRAAVSTTGTIAINVTQEVLRRTGFFEDTQNAFGSSFGSGLGGFKAGPGGSGSGVPGSAEPQGRPDTFGAMAALQEITPRTALKLKGFKLLSIDVIYTVSAAALTTAQLRVDQIQYVNGAAVPAATAVLAQTANGILPQAFGANVIAFNVAIPNPVYTILADTVLWVEMNIVTPGGGTFDFRGFDMLFEFNFN